MSAKRKDSKGRNLRNGEVQRPDGMYMFRYTDQDGKRRAIYSWKLVSTDNAPEGKRYKAALRDMEKEVLRDIEDDIRTADANAPKESESGIGYEYRISEPKTKAGFRTLQQPPSSVLHHNLHQYTNKL